MSIAVNLMSVVTGAQPEGQAVPATATVGFTALFGEDGASKDASQGIGDDATGAKALKGLYNIVAGLDKKAAQLDPEGDDPEGTLGAVAGLATDLATALAGFEGETGSGLVLQLQGDASDEAALVEAGAATTTLADAMAAVQALKSVLSTVTGALRDMAAAQTAKGPQLRAGTAGLALVGDGLAIAPVPEGGGASGMEVSAESSAAITLAATVLPSSKVTNPAAGAARTPEANSRGSVQAAAAMSMSGGSQLDADVLPLPLVVSSAQSGGDGGARALLDRVVAVAADISGTGGSAPDMVPGAVAGLEATTVARRLGPVEPLITPEDVARVLAQGAQAGRESLTTAASAKGAETAGEPSRFAGAVASQISSAEIGEGRTRIELSPRGLGTIEVDVTTGSDGALKVVVRAENPAVLNALREERDLLAQVLGGLDMGSLDLQSFSDSNGQTPQDERPAALAMSSGDEIAATGAEAAPTHKAEIGGGRLDIVT